MKTFVQSIIDIILGPETRSKKPKQRFVPVEDLPDFMQGHKRLKGVFVGGCILDPNGEWDKEVSAHAHCHKGDPGLGYICCMNEKKFSSKLLLKHETAHILSRDANNKGHGRAWAAVYVALKDPTNKWLTVRWLKQKYQWGTKKKDPKNATANKPGS